MAISATAMDMVRAMVPMDMESAMLSQRLMLNLSLMLMLSMVHMEDMVLDTVLILWDMVMAILATLLLATVMDMVLAMVPMDMESVMLRPSQRLMPMLSMDHMVSTAMDTVLAMAVMGMESAMLNQSLMLSMEPMVGMAMDLDTVHTPWDMDTDMVMDLAM